MVTETTERIILDILGLNRKEIKSIEEKTEWIKSLGMSLEYYEIFLTDGSRVCLDSLEIDINYMATREHYHEQFNY
jgi:hypothetical protein